MTGGGKRNSLLAKFSKFCKKNTYFSSNYIFSLFYIFSLLKKRYLLKKIYKKLNHYGGILIEFAFSIPILIFLLLFVLDHYRFYELKSKVKSSAYFAASMAQQLCNTNEDKQLTTKDLGRITYASFMNFFHTNTQFSPCPFGVRPKAHWVYVKRVNSNSYSYQSFNTFAMAQNLSSALTMERLLTSQTTKDAATIAKLSPDLICDKDGDERVLIWCYYHAFSGFENSKSKLGFYIIPIHITSYTNLDAIVSSTVINPLQFQYKLVFTPKPGLFPIKQ